MPGASSGLLRAGLALKVNQLKRATRSYLRDRANQATGTVASYAIAAGLFAASGIFLIAACFVGIAALFRWVEITYGRFPAFGVVGALLLLIALVLASLAASRLKRSPPQFPSLSSRLRVAIKANPVQPDQVEAVRETAEAILMAPSGPAPQIGRRRRRAPHRGGPGNATVKAGLILTATLLGWAAARRRQTRRTAV
jgi:hypothetical protein